MLRGRHLPFVHSGHLEVGAGSLAGGRNGRAVQMLQTTRIRMPVAGDLGVAAERGAGSMLAS
jgi:hypothetical protein